jgi:HEAT repeat protein
MTVLQVRRAAAGFLGLIAIVAFRGVCHGQSPIDSVMDRNPPVPMAKAVKIYAAELPALWIEALSHRDVETRVAAAQTIAAAHREGMPGLEAAIAPLIRALDQPGQHSTVRLAIAHALVALDAKQAADSLIKLLEPDDPELREIVEPALARWDYRPARAIWLERLSQGPPYRRRHILGIQSLGTVREEKAAAKLRELVLSSSVSMHVRLEAARALAEISTSGLEKDAAVLAVDGSVSAAPVRLLAASLLRHHQGAEAIRLLQALARDAEPTVAAASLARLIEIDTKLVVPILDSTLASQDANVRTFGVQVLLRQPSDEHIRQLGDRLADPHPGVRDQARKALRELAGREELKGFVVRDGTRMLAGADWRGQEQSALLLAEIGHQPATKRLLELLRAERPEVFVSAAWALRRLAVADTVPDVFEFVRGEHRKLLASGPSAGRPGVSADAVDRQLTQLVQFIGQAKYQPAEAKLREMLVRFSPGGPPGSFPPSPVGPETRAAVAWSLGMIHEGKPQADVARLLEARLADVPPIPGPENSRVRTMAAVALGSMKAKDALPTLHRFHSEKPSLDPVSNACGWALSQITGEAVLPGVVEQPQINWFLTHIP